MPSEATRGLRVLRCKGCLPILFGGAGAPADLHSISCLCFNGRIYKECQAAGIALRNYEFDCQRRKIVEAGVLEKLPNLWNDEKFQRRNPLLQTLLTGTIPLNDDESDLVESNEP